jgi:hypothetical protein
MLRELVLAIGIPLALLLLAVLALERWGNQLPPLASAHQSTTLPDLEHRHRNDHRPVVAALAAAALMVQGIDSSS